MATTYLVLNTATATAVCGYRNALPTVFDSNRLFWRFDLTGSGLVLANITSVIFRMTVTAVLGTNDYRLRTGSAANNWGTALDATQADFESTNVNIEGTQTISTTGAKDYTINKNNLDLNGINWVRLAFVTVDSSQERVTVGMQEHATQGSRPQLIITSQTGGPTHLAALGVGGPGIVTSVTTWYGDDTDGQIRASDPLSEPDPDRF